MNKKHIIAPKETNPEYIDKRCSLNDKFIIMSEDDINQHYDGVPNFKNLKIGQFILYEKLVYAGYFSDFPRDWDLSYPEVGVVINLEKKALETIFTVEKLKTGAIFDLTHGLFNNYIVIDIWDNKPNFRELKAAYNKTLWYRKTIQEKRDLIINNILQ